MTTTDSQTDVCGHCLEVHAIPVAGENWQASQDPTWEIYQSLSCYAEYVPVYWDTVTPGSSWEAWEDMIRSVAVDYLRNGDVKCCCGRSDADA